MYYSLCIWLLLCNVGSGQQSVTGVDTADDANSYWRIRGKPNEICQRGVPIKCGQAIRFTHMKTGRNLHSHHFSSPLSSNQVICLFVLNLTSHSHLYIQRVSFLPPKQARPKPERCGFNSSLLFIGTSNLIPTEMNVFKREINVYTYSKACLFYQMIHRPVVHISRFL